MNGDHLLSRDYGILYPFPYSNVVKGGLNAHVLISWPTMYMYLYATQHTYDKFEVM